MTNDFESILGQVIKPARYLGLEWNVTKKNFSEAKVKIALCFPDLYEVGMSHLGFRIIYGLLNSMDGVLCERVFSPWPDFSDILFKKGLPLFSLESQTSISKFDIVAFSLAYEMNYTNILEMLRLARIPLRADERGNEYPLVIGGGPCTLNPEPICDFFDLFVIGDGEEVVMEIIDTYTKMKGAKNKSSLLSELSKIEGVYVPSIFEVEKSLINKRILGDLDKGFYPTKYLVPYVNIIHDRVVIEIMRGCVHRCRFCQASSCYEPARFRSEKKILNLVKSSYGNTGYEEFSLMSLSSGSYPGLTDLIEKISNMNILKDKGVSISLSSLRIEDVLSKLPQSIRKIKKTGLTFAPEAGTERLRKVISKKINIDKLFQAVTIAQNEGWRRVKLYFMIGLPTENDSDIEGIINILDEIRESTKRGIFELSVSISPFIPKPHTPFQWERMEGIEELSRKEQYIKKHNTSRRIKLKFHNLKLSFMEGVFSRGDRKLGKVLSSANNLGAKFDSWDEFFSFDTWMKAFDKEGVDPESYIKKRRFDEKLPWDHINVGVTKAQLLEEAKKAHSLH